MSTKRMYWMLAEGMETPKGSTDLEMLAKDADQCKGIVLVLSDRYNYDRPIEPTDYDIVYVGGESKVLGNLK